MLMSGFRAREATVPVAAYDADQHYYETEDALTRHLDPAHRASIRWAEIDGRRRLLVGDRLFQMIVNPTFDPIGKPGSLADYFRAKNTAGVALRDMIEWEPLQ